MRVAHAIHIPEPSSVDVYESLHRVFTSAYRSLEETNEALFALVTRQEARLGLIEHEHD